MAKVDGNKQAAEKKYTREALLESKAFSMYQKDFLAVLLKKDSYTLSEAREIIDGFFGPNKEGK